MPSKTKIVLPSDHLASLTFGGEPVEIGQANIEGELIGLDIGPSTLANFNDYLKSAKTVLWNGPMGLFENAAYSKGTFGIAKTLASLEGKAFTLVGGGDSVAAVNQSGLASKMSHISTGGGASLEYIENGTLPGIQALKFGID